MPPEADETELGELEGSEETHSPDEPEVPAKSKGKKPDDDVKLSKKDYEALLKERDELRGSERYWADQAKSGARKAEPEPGDDDADDDDDDGLKDDTPDKFTDDLSAKGIEALVKRGVITKKTAKEMFAKLSDRMLRNVERMVDEKISGVAKRATKDAQLLQRYPELGDAQSDFTKRTGDIYKELIEEDPDIKKSTALALAARMTRAETKDDERRIERIDRQRGDSGRRLARSESDDSLGPQSAEMIKAFGSYGVTEESMRKYRR